MKRATFTPAQIELIKQLREVFCLSWEEIGKRFGTGHHTVRRAVDPEHDKKMTAQESARDRAKERHKALDLRSMRPDQFIVPQSVENRRWQYLNAPHRSEGDRILGCPPLGFSALDRKRAEQRA